MYAPVPRRSLLSSLATLEQQVCFSSAAMEIEAEAIHCGNCRFIDSLQIESLAVIHSIAFVRPAYSLLSEN